MIRKSFLFVFFCLLIIQAHAQAKEHTSGASALINPPYYFNYGYLNSWDDTRLYAPYIGLGMRLSLFSIAPFAQAGLSVQHKIFTWGLEYAQGLMPDVAFFPDYKKLEYYGQNTFSLNFNAARLSSVTKLGNMLQAYPGANEEELERNVFTTLSLREILALDVQFYNDDLTIFTGTFELGFDYVPFFNQSSFFIRTEMPVTFDFIHSKLGLMPSLFYARYLWGARSLMIQRKYYGYDAANALTSISDADYFNRWYDFTGALDLVYRIYFRSLPSPTDRMYISLGGNIGFGMNLDRGGKADLLYMATLGFGYELYDIIPFEIRFSVDQDARAFVNLTIISPIAHRFDNRPK